MSPLCCQIISILGFEPRPFSVRYIPSGVPTPNLATMIQANLRKARRRGLRRIKSAMTTAILGVVLAATTVKAQQSNPSGRESLGQSQRPSRTARPGSTRPSPDDQVYGVAVTRGARYLLRNGLDYLNYKEYDRALKFSARGRNQEG